MTLVVVERTGQGRPQTRTNPMVGAAGSLVLFGSSLLPLGCVRAPEPCLLELDQGDLVISEIRGPQAGPDTRGEWFEVYNASGRPLELRGLRGVLTNLQGTLQLDFFVRQTLMVPEGDTVVLGSLVLDPNRRPELDYSFNADFRVSGRDPFDDDDPAPIVLPDNENTDPRSLFANARIDLLACDQLIDRVVYAELPSLGTYSLDGRVLPDDTDNDDPTRWCVDDREAPPAPDGSLNALGRPGSAGEANPVCP